MRQKTRLFNLSLIALLVVAMCYSLLPSLQGQQNEPSAPSLADVLFRTGISSWQEAGWTGNGHGIGVLAQGFRGLDTFIAASGVNVTVIGELSQSATNQGTQYLEIIHAIAPNSPLSVCEYRDFESYRSCATALQHNGTKIILHDTTLPSVPLTNVSDWTRLVSDIAASGILWVNAAGNYAQGTVLQAYFDTNGDSAQDFLDSTGETSDRLVVSDLPAGSLIALGWESTDQGQTPNLDLEVYDADSTLVAESRSSEQTRQNLEFIRVSSAGTVGIRVVTNDANPSVRFLLAVEFAVLPNSVVTSVLTPADSPDALTVGALDEIEVASYSSRGSGSASVKPDLVAPGSVLTSDGRVIFGTGTSAALVAGAAALLWEASPQMSAQELRVFIREQMTIDDLQIPGIDNISGYGQLNMRVPQISPSVTPTQTPTASETPKPSITPTLTNTDTPTMTHTPSETPTATFTLTATSDITNTPMIGATEIAATIYADLTRAADAEASAEVAQLATEVSGQTATAIQQTLAAPTPTAPPTQIIARVFGVNGQIDPTTPLVFTRVGSPIRVEALRPYQVAVDSTNGIKYVRFSFLDHFGHDYGIPRTEDTAPYCAWESQLLDQCGPMDRSMYYSFDPDLQYTLKIEIVSDTIPQEILPILIPFSTVKPEDNFIEFDFVDLRDGLTISNVGETDFRVRAIRPASGAYYDGAGIDGITFELRDRNDSFVPIPPISGINVRDGIVVETTAPFCAFGTAANQSTCLPMPRLMFDNMPDGEYTLYADIYFNDGTEHPLEVELAFVLQRP